MTGTDNSNGKKIDSNLQGNSDKIPGNTNIKKDTGNELIQGLANVERYINIFTPRNRKEIFSEGNPLEGTNDEVKFFVARYFSKQRPSALITYFEHFKCEDKDKNVVIAYMIAMYDGAYFMKSFENLGITDEEKCVGLARVILAKSQKDYYDNKLADEIGEEKANDTAYNLYKTTLELFIDNFHKMKILSPYSLEKIKPLLQNHNKLLQNIDTTKISHLL